MVFKHRRVDRFYRKNRPLSVWIAIFAYAFDNVFSFLNFVEKNVNVFKIKGILIIK